MNSEFSIIGNRFLNQSEQLSGICLTKNVFTLVIVSWVSIDIELIQQEMNAFDSINSLTGFENDNILTFTAFFQSIIKTG